MLAFGWQMANQFQQSVMILSQDQNGFRRFALVMNRRSIVERDFLVTAAVTSDVTPLFVGGA